MSTLEKIKAGIAETLRCYDVSTNVRFIIFEIIDKYAEQEPCENCCNGNQIEKARLCQKSYLAGMEHKQEPSDDAISRQAVLDLLEDTNNGWVINEVLQLPSVRPQEQTGHWIKKDGYSDCSECGSHIVTEWDYCPNCGAKMVEPKESEDMA